MAFKPLKLASKCEPQTSKGPHEPNYFPDSNEVIMRLLSCVDVCPNGVRAFVISLPEPYDESLCQQAWHSSRQLPVSPTPVSYLRMSRWRIKNSMFVFYVMHKALRLHSVCMVGTSTTPMERHVYLKELPNYGYSDLEIWQVLSWKWMTRACHFMENNWQYLSPVISQAFKWKNSQTCICHELDSFLRPKGFFFWWDGWWC